MAAMFTYLADKLLDHANGKTAYTMPTVYVGLSTTASSAGTPGTEAAYTGYARVALSGLIGAAASNSATNTGVINFPLCTGGSSAVVGFFTYDALTGGNPLLFGACSLSVSAGITPQFAASALTDGMA